LTGEKVTLDEVKAVGATTADIFSVLLTMGRAAGVNFVSGGGSGGHPVELGPLFEFL
jgi:hypothetical protein